MSEHIKTENQKAIKISAIALLVAIFTPYGMNMISHPYGLFAANLVWVFGSFFFGSSIPIDDGGMVPPTINPAAGLPGLLVFVVRVLFVWQIYRAYNNKTSRAAALYMGVFSEILMVIINLPIYIFSIGSGLIGGLYIPLPLLLLVGGLLLWKFPPFVPTTPWETVTDSEDTPSTEVAESWLGDE
jgi:hypothetical protein